jgi:hypothetical protein
MLHSMVQSRCQHLRTALHFPEEWYIASRYKMGCCLQYTRPRSAQPRCPHFQGGGHLCREGALAGINVAWQCVELHSAGENCQQGKQDSISPQQREWKRGGHSMKCCKWSVRSMQRDCIMYSCAPALCCYNTLYAPTAASRRCHSERQESH